jgi:hypothetical protein
LDGKYTDYVETDDIDNLESHLIESYQDEAGYNWANAQSAAKASA